VRASVIFQLPDFLAAIEKPRNEHPQLPSMASSNVSGPPLRYDAYDAPLAPHGGTVRSISSSSSLSSHFEAAGHDELHAIEGSVTKIFTPGDLSLVAQEVDMRNHKTTNFQASNFKQVDQSTLESGFRPNLINLDSPFYSDPISESIPHATETDTSRFENFWSLHSDQTVSARSWCEAAPADVEQQLRHRGFNIVTFSDPGMPANTRECKRLTEQRHLVGSSKVAFTSSDSPGLVLAALLVKAQGLNVSIWTLRCPDPMLKAQIEDALSFSA
jgi:hypothetical protein